MHGVEFLVVFRNADLGGRANAKGADRVHVAAAAVQIARATYDPHLCGGIERLDRSGEGVAWMRTAFGHRRPLIAGGLRILRGFVGHDSIVQHVPRNRRSASDRMWHLIQ